MNELPYSGCRVLDMTQGVAGPHATMLLALNGADVIKVEPLEGDWARKLGKTSGDSSVNFFAFNRAKRSLSIDLKTNAGRAVIEELTRKCDIVVESFKPGTASRLGIGLDDVRRIHPDAIYASISGFGQTGPESSRAAVDSLLQAYSGMMVMNAAADGTPQRSPMIIVDVVTGLYAFQAISNAFIRRLRFGIGAHLDISMMQSAAAFQASKIMEHWESGGAPQPLYVPAGAFRTADGHLTISGMRKAHFEAICTVLGVPDLASDPRWPAQEDRIVHGDEINARLQAEFLKHPTSHWLPRLSEVGVMAEKVRNYDQWLQETHVQETHSFAWANKTPFGSLPILKIPGLMADDLGEPIGTAPGIGMHSREILEELGMPPSWIDDQVRFGVVIDCT